MWILVYHQIFEWEPFCNRIGFGLVIEMGAGKTTIFKAQIQYYMGSLYKSLFKIWISGWTFKLYRNLDPWECKTDINLKALNNYFLFLSYKEAYSFWVPKET